MDKWKEIELEKMKVSSLLPQSVIVNLSTHGICYEFSKISMIYYQMYTEVCY